MFYQGKICIIHPLFKIEFWLKEQEIIFKQNAAKMKKIIFVLFTRPNTLGTFFFSWVLGFLKVQLIQISQKSDYNLLWMN